MPPFKLFRVKPDEGNDRFIVATKHAHAVELFVGLQLDAGDDPGAFTIEQVDHKLAGDDRAGLDDLLAHGPAGLTVQDGLFGWSRPA